MMTNNYVYKLFLRKHLRRHIFVMCLAGAVANVADPDRCRCNPKVPGSIPAGGKDFP